MSNYLYAQRSKLAATCKLEGAQKFVKIKAEAWLDVQTLIAYEPKLFAQVSRDFERGYRTTEDDLLCAVEDSFLQWAKADWEMSYFGKAKIKLYVPFDDRMAALKQEVSGLIELMQSKVTFHTTFDRYLVAEAPVSRGELKEDKNYRKRRMPVVDHQFQQLRPLLLTTFESWESRRIEIRRLWADRPLIPLEW